MASVLKRPLRWVMSVGCVLPLAAAPATVLFHCLSPRIEPAVVNAQGQHRLAFNFSNVATENGELAVLEDDASNEALRGTGFELSAPGFGVPIEGFLYLDTPQADTNHNGIDDLFEVAQGLSPVNTSGTLEFTTIDDEPVKGTVVAQWQRPAGVTRGSVQIAVAFPGYSRTFQHAFEVYQYRGTLEYTRRGTNIDATVALSREGAPGALGGAWTLHVEDRDSLAQEGGAWVAGRPLLRFDPTVTDADGTRYEFLRGGLRTNYFGIFQYSDGSPVDDIPLDYALWELHLFDPNDADGDQVPDLTDTDFIGLPEVLSPQVSVAWEAGAPRMRLVGSPGVGYVVEQRESLTVGAWAAVSTNAPASNGVADVPLSLKGANGLRFWRARVP